MCSKIVKYKNKMQYGQKIVTLKYWVDGASKSVSVLVCCFGPGMEEVVWLMMTVSKMHLY